MTVPAAVEAAIVEHAQRTAPEECCGLLIGTADALVEAVPVANVAPWRLREYVIDPREHFTAIREARRRALEVVGVYHSHPRSRAVPSQTDREQAFAGFVFLIVGLAVEPPELAAWMWSDGNFAAVPLVRLL